MEKTTLRHWRRTTGEDGICRLVFSKSGSSANTLSREVLLDLNEHLTAIANERPRGVLIESAKPTGFILGADVKEFEHVTDAAEGARLAKQGQDVLARLEALPMPTVAVIDGFALGGGLELALACRYRVAVRGYDRNIGLPEVQLGIHPGFGGTVRLVRLLGAPRALDLMLTGRSLSPVEAHKVGLVDRLAERDDLDRVARELVDAPPRRQRAGWWHGALRLKPARHAVANRIRGAVSKRADPRHYPAPHALLDCLNSDGVISTPTAWGTL